MKTRVSVHVHPLREVVLTPPQGETASSAPRPPHLHLFCISRSFHSDLLYTAAVWGSATALYPLKEPSLTHIVQRREKMLFTHYYSVWARCKPPLPVGLPLILTKLSFTLYVQGCLSCLCFVFCASLLLTFCSFFFSL